MPKIKYIDANHKATSIEVAIGLTVMHGAVVNMVQGILAECGGALTCATCHCYVDEKWLGKTGLAEGKEKLKLSKVKNTKANSRLSCQLKVTADLDGLIVHLPKSQVWSH
ncbi:MAG: 2Fe-2S ferredoxin [Gammaproteobacteria bacterium]|nr:MAG: 2Fe-2S ferredoxin [Gammaproteobacteria bacterium]